jgi:hypothetical protein
MANPYGKSGKSGRRVPGAKPAAGPSLKLGRFIFDETPYPNPQYPKIGRGPGVKIYGPGKRFVVANGGFKIADVRKRKSQEVGHLSKAKVKKVLREGLYWKIGRKTERMSKVIRIPYRYHDPVLNTMAKAALVIAWEGGGGGC